MSQSSSSKRPRQRFSKKLIGVIHLPPLPGAPLASNAKPPVDILNQAGRRAIQEAKTFQSHRFDGVILENFGDVPFYADNAPAETISALSVIATAIREEAPRLKLGVNVLRNDTRGALAIASVTGAQFIRANVLSGVSATDQGLVEGDSAWLLRERARLGSRVAIFGDICVKHAQSLSHPSLIQAFEETSQRALADSCIISGETTGRSVELKDLRELSPMRRKLKTSLFLGSGVTADQVADFSPYVDGFIVSSYLRRGGKAGAPLDTKRIGQLTRALSSKKKKATIKKK